MWAFGAGNAAEQRGRADERTKVAATGTKSAAEKTAGARRAKSVAVPSQRSVAAQRPQQQQHRQVAGTGTGGKTLAPIKCAPKKSTV